MKTIPSEHDIMFRSYTADSQTHMVQNDRGEERSSNTRNSVRQEEIDCIIIIYYNI